MSCREKKCPGSGVFFEEDGSFQRRHPHNHEPNAQEIARRQMMAQIKERSEKEDIPLETIFQEESLRFGAPIQFKTVKRTMERYRSKGDTIPKPPKVRVQLVTVQADGTLLVSERAECLQYPRRRGKKRKMGEPGADDHLEMSADAEPGEYQEADSDEEEEEEEGEGENTIEEYTVKVEEGENTGAEQGEIEEEYSEQNAVVYQQEGTGEMVYVLENGEALALLQNQLGFTLEEVAAPPPAPAPSVPAAPCAPSAPPSAPIAPSVAAAPSVTSAPSVPAARAARAAPPSAPKARTAAAPAVAAPQDKWDVFAKFVASEIRSLRQEHRQSEIKKKIMAAIMEFS